MFAGELKTLEEYWRRKIANCLERFHGKYSFFLRAHTLAARNSWEIKEHLDHRGARERSHLAAPKKSSGQPTDVCFLIPLSPSNSNRLSMPSTQPSFVASFLFFLRLGQGYRVTSQTRWNEGGRFLLRMKNVATGPIKKERRYTYVDDRLA